MTYGWDEDQSEDPGHDETGTEGRQESPCDARNDR